MKHLFTVLTGAAVGVVAWGGYHLFSPSTGSPNARLSGPPIPEVAGVDEEEKASLDELELAVDGLEQRLADTRGDPGEEPLLALGPEVDRSEGTSEPAERKTASAPPPPPLPGRHLSLIMDGSERRAVIDGRLVSEGEELTEGGRVADIRSRSVRIQESHGRYQEIALDDLDGLGTLRAASSRDSQAGEMTR